MIQSAFDRFILIFFENTAYKAFICAIWKNGAIFLLIFCVFSLKFSCKSEHAVILQKNAPFFILAINLHDNIVFQRI